MIMETVTKKCGRCRRDFESRLDSNFCDNCISDDRDEDMENDDLKYWECLCCNYSCVRRPAWGGQCPKCGTHMEEGYL